MTNPLRQVHDAIWRTLESSSAFTRLVPNENRVKYTATQGTDPDLDEASHADFPRVRVTLAKWNPDQKHNTSGLLARATFLIEVCSGEQHQGMLTDLIWAVTCAFADWPNRLREGTSWTNGPFVACVYLRETVLTRDNDALSRKLDQWMAIWTADVDLDLKTISLQQEN